MARIGHLLIFLYPIIVYLSFVETATNNSWCLPDLSTKVETVNKKVRYSRYNTDGQLLSNKNISEKFKKLGVKYYTSGNTGL